MSEGLAQGSYVAPMAGLNPRRSGRRQTHLPTVPPRLINVSLGSLKFDLYLTVLGVNNQIGKCLVRLVYHQRRRPSAEELPRVRREVDRLTSNPEMAG